MEIEIVDDGQIFIQPETLRHIPDIVNGFVRCLGAGLAPSTSTLPDVGRSSPASKRMSVVLPAASGPTSPTTKPEGTSAVRLESAGGVPGGTSGKTLETP